jgi:Domain of unknown function (DUF4347)
MSINWLVNTTTGTEQSRSNSFPTVQVLAFIDSSITDYQNLMAGTLLGVEAILLKADRNGIEQITEVLANRQDVTTVHLVSHGTPGCLYLGNSQTSLDTLSDCASQLKEWLKPTENSIPTLTDPLFAKRLEEKHSLRKSTSTLMQDYRLSETHWN